MGGISRCQRLRTFEESRGVNGANELQQSQQLGLGGISHRVLKAANYALLAKDNHCVEEWWRNGLANDGNADRVDKQAGFDAARFSDGSCGVIASVVIPFGKRRKGIGSFRQQLRHFGIFPEFLFCGGITRKIIAEKSARPTGKIR